MKSTLEAGHSGGPLHYLVLGMTDSKKKWNRIYASGSHVFEPAAVLRRNVDLIQTRGLALDIACGTGSNAIFLASLGLNVHAWDI